MSDYVIVYRIEDASWRGAYRVSWVFQWPYDEIRHPAPSRDGFEEPVTREHLFGFESMEALRDWFQPKELRYLDKHNARQTVPGIRMHLSVIRVPRESVIYGYHQLGFLGDDADRIMRLPLDPELIAQL